MKYRVKLVREWQWFHIFSKKIMHVLDIKVDYFLMYFAIALYHINEKVKPDVRCRKEIIFRRSND